MKKQTRRVRGMGLLVIGVVIFSIFIVIMFTVIATKLQSTGVNSSILSGSTLFFFAFLLLYPTIMLFFAIRSFLREKRIRKWVPTLNGRYCPKCRIEMTRENDDANGEGEGDSTSTCPKCQSAWPALELCRYWENFVLARRESYLLWRELRLKYEPPAKGLRKLLRTIWAFANAHPAQWSTIIFSIMGLIYILIATIFFHQHWTSIVIMLLRYGIFFIGITLMGMGIKRRRGRSAHCAACDYEKSPMLILEATSLCPECGAAWNEAGGTVQGTVSQKSGFLTVGIIMSVLGFYFLNTGNTGALAGFTAKVIPTPALVQQLGNNSRSSPEAWQELQTRELSDEDVDTLATLLMDQRIEIGHFAATTGAGWLDSQINVGKLSTEIEDRYYRELLVFSIAGPQRAEVGQELTFSLIGGNRVATGLIVEAVIGGFYVDNILSLETRGAHWHPAYNFDTELNEMTKAEQIPPFITQFTTPGTYQIIVKVWIIGLPGHGLALADPWDTNGKVVLPAKTLWSRQITVEHEVVISE